MLILYVFSHVLERIFTLEISISVTKAYFLYLNLYTFTSQLRLMSCWFCWVNSYVKIANFCVAVWLIRLGIYYSISSLKSVFFMYFINFVCSYLFNNKIVLWSVVC